MQNQDIYEKILLILYERRDSNTYVNLFLYLQDVEKKTLRAKALELQAKKLIDVEPTPPRVSFHSTGGYSSYTRVSAERRRRKRDEQFNAKINYEGVHYVKQNLMKMDDKKIEINNSGQIGNLNTGKISGGQSNKGNLETDKSSSRKKESGLNNKIIKILVAVIGGVITALIIWKITGTPA